SPRDVLDGLGERLVEGLDPYRYRGRHRVVRSAEGVAERDAERPREQVVERDVDGGARRGSLRPALRRLAADRRRATGVASGEPREPVAAERRRARVDRLARDMLSRRPRAEARRAGVRLDLDDDVADAVERRLAGDRVGTRERELLEAG